MGTFADVVNDVIVPAMFKFLHSVALHELVVFLVVNDQSR